MKWMGGVAALALVGCALVLAGSAGADKPPQPPVSGAHVPGDKQLPAGTGPAAQSSSAGYTFVDSGSLASFDGYQNYGLVECPPGTVVWGGGVFIASTSVLASVNSSWPYNRKGWQAWVSNASGADTTFDVFAVCGNEPAGYQIVRGTFHNPSGLHSSGSVFCPSSAVPLGGGAFSYSVDVYANINSTYPINSPTKAGWDTDVNNGSGDDTTFTTYAICVKKPGPPGYEIVLGRDYANPSATQDAAFAICPAAKRPAGAGVQSSSQELFVNVNSVYPYLQSPAFGGAWVNNAGALDQVARTYVICVS
jgi:hypothetical protein